MGQDSSCGICDKHYQDCKHYMKEHIPTDGDRSLCGRKIEKLVMLPKDWEQRDCDPDDICLICMKKYGGVDKYQAKLLGDEWDMSTFDYHFGFSEE